MLTVLRFCCSSAVIRLFFVVVDDIDNDAVVFVVCYRLTRENESL